jgi:hypothetical protein
MSRWSKAREIAECWGCGVMGEGTGCRVESGIHVLGKHHATILCAMAASRKRVSCAKFVLRVVGRSGSVE